MYLPSFNKTITVPALPEELHYFDYATEEAMVAIPKACVSEYSENLKASVPLEDQPPHGATGMAYARMSDIEGKYGTLAKMLETCSCGMVLFLHGTGGPGWNTVAQAAMLSGFGFLVVMPDSQAMPDDLHLKGRLPLKPVAEIDMSNFCGSYSEYEGSCSKFNKPFCYTTRAANILENAIKYRAYVQRIYQIRIRELDYFMQSSGGKSLLETAKQVFLLGNSEGSVITRVYHNEALDAKLSGRIIMSGSCDYNYFAPCAAAGKVCGHQCRKDVPQLNIIGSVDDYFGRQSTSVSQTVASNKTNGYGGPITGNCRAEYDAYGFTQAYVVEARGAGHGVMYWNSNLVRSVLADFVNTPERTISEESSNIFECKKELGVYSCASGHPVTCTPDYTVNPNATWMFSSLRSTGCLKAEEAAAAL